MADLASFDGDAGSDNSENAMQYQQNTDSVYKKVHKDQEDLLKEMMLNSQQNLEKCSKLEEENKNFFERNRDLKESLYSLAEKVDKRDQDLSEVVDKLTELENELELSKIENIQLRSQLERKENIEHKKRKTHTHTSFMQK